MVNDKKKLERQQARSYVRGRLFGASRVVLAVSPEIGDYRSYLLEYTYFKHLVPASRANYLTRLYLSWQASGLSQAKYAREHHVSSNTLRYAAAFVEETGDPLVLKLISPRDRLPKCRFVFTVITARHAVCRCRFRSRGPPARAPPGGTGTPHNLRSVHRAAGAGDRQTNQR